MEKIIQGDCLEVLKTLPDNSVHMCVTSPPYWGLRDYGVDGQLGLEQTPEEYVEKLVEVFREVRRVLRDDGTLWLNLGDSYANNSPGGRRMSEKSTIGRSHGGKGEPIVNAPSKTFHVPSKQIPDGLKPKDLVGIPWRVAFALQADGWYLRSDIIWHKPNAMPESVKDRPTKAHEYIFLLSKSPKYYYDADAIREPFETEMKGKPHSKKYGRITKDNKDDRSAKGSSGAGFTRNNKGRNRRTVWTVATRPFRQAHFAVFPPDLIEPCVLAGSPEKACPHCGAPWVRVTESVRGFDENGLCRGCGRPRNKHVVSEKSLFRKHDWWARGTTTIQEDGAVPCGANKTIGWQPTCQCENNDGSGKGIVLDPFFGSGTTGLVARKHGRGFIGIELNPEYIKIAKSRVMGG